MSWISTTALDFGGFFGNCVLLTPGAIIMVGLFFFFDFLPSELDPEELDEDEDDEDDEDEELDDGGPPPPPLLPHTPLQHQQAQQTYRQVDQRHQSLPLDDSVAMAG